MSKIEKSLYVDDLNTGVKNDQEGFKFYKESKEIFLKAGLNLRKWITNSTKLQEMINRNEKTLNVETQDLDEKSYAETVLDF